jgi:glycosyltransferase involved in cell wall biosynthesis
MMDVAHFLVLHGKPSVVTYHSDIVRQRFLYSFYRPIMHRFLASADTIVATSPAYVRTSPVLRRYRDKVRVIPIGIDDAPLRNPDPALLQRWRAKVGSGFFLFIGVARYYKRLDVLLEAARGTGMPVVIASELLGTLDANGPIANPAELGAKLAQSEQVRSCYVTNNFRFFYGREVEQADACSFARLLVDFKGASYNLTELLVALTRTDAFLYRGVTP